MTEQEVGAEEEEEEGADLRLWVESISTAYDIGVRMVL